MKIIYLYLLLSSFLVSGCNLFGNKEKGDYYLETISPLTKSTFRNGGTFFVFRLMPNDEFKGRVNLHAVSQSGFEVYFTRNPLSSSQRITEMIVIPDSSAAEGIHPFAIVSTHSGRSDTLQVAIQISEQIGLSRNFYKDQLASVFSWLNSNYPHFGIDPQAEWTCFKAYQAPSSPLYLSFLNENWEIMMKTPASPYNNLMTLRRRGEEIPMFAGVSNINGWMEITVEQAMTREYTIPLFFR